MPVFSVIIPVYNAANTLPATIASLQAQSSAGWEAIFVDDGSVDASARVVAAAARDDRRLRLVQQPNAGPSVARNAGAAQARGRWLAFLDADDIWLPSKLAEIADMAAKPDAPAAVFGAVGFMDRADQPDCTRSTVPSGAVTLAQLAGENPVCTLSNLTVRADVFARLGGFDAAITYAEDLEFLVRLVSAGHRLVGRDSLQVRYRTSRDGLSANLLQMHDGWRRAVASAGPRLSARDTRRGEAIHLRYLARRALRVGKEPWLAARLALRGLVTSPAGFLSNRYRGVVTLAAAVSAPVLPPRLRARVFR